MKIISPIEEYYSLKFNANILIDVPDSGFSLYFGKTGASGSFSTGFGFYGSGGMIFDNSGNFFGGYHSGRQNQIEGNLFGRRLSYFYNGSLINNNFPSQKFFNAIEFDKHRNSQLILDIDYFQKEDSYIDVYANQEMVLLENQIPIQVPEQYAND